MPDVTETGLTIESVKALPLAELIERFAYGVENLDAAIIAMKAEALDMAYLPDAGVGRWPMRVLVGHLADCELLFAMRVRRTVAEDQPVLSVMDEHAYIDSGIYGTEETGERYPVAGFVAMIHTTRKWMAEWLGTLDVDQWQRAAMHPQTGQVTIHDMICYDVWHLEHHAAIADQKVAYLRSKGMIEA